MWTWSMKPHSDVHLNSVFFKKTSSQTHRLHLVATSWGLNWITRVIQFCKIALDSFIDRVKLSIHNIVFDMVGSINEDQTECLLLSDFIFTEHWTVWSAIFYFIMSLVICWLIYMHIDCKVHGLYGFDKVLSVCLFILIIVVEVVVIVVVVVIQWLLLLL